MTNKEIGELRRRMKPDRTNFTAVYGCYVAGSGEILSTFREPFGLMAEEDKEKYLAIFRRALSGTPDKNLIDLSFTTKQVADSDEHRLLMRLRETALDDEEARQKLFQTIIGAVSFEENFLILLAHERYDVPFKARDGAKLEDGSEVFSYFVCAVCPVKPGKELLSYIAEEKTFHNRSAGWAAGMPEAGFLFPAFDGRRTNLYNCLFYTHSSGADNQPLIDALFHVQPPMPADEQRDTFSGVLRNALDGVDINTGIATPDAAGNVLSSDVYYYNEDERSYYALNVAVTADNYTDFTDSTKPYAPVSNQLDATTSPEKSVWLNIYNAADNFLSATYQPLLENYDDLLNLKVDYIGGDGQTEANITNRLGNPSAYDAFAINMVKTDNAASYTSLLNQ